MQVLLKTAIKYYYLKFVTTMYLLKEFAICAPQKTHQETDEVLLKYGKDVSETPQNTTGFHKYSIFQLTALWTTTVPPQQ